MLMLTYVLELCPSAVVIRTDKSRHSYLRVKDPTPPHPLHISCKYQIRNNLLWFWFYQITFNQCFGTSDNLLKKKTKKKPQVFILSSCLNGRLF